MTDDDMEIVRGSGNVFRDFGYPDADVRQAKALLAAQIIKVLDAEELSTRQAEARTGIAHSDFVRIRNVNLGRFTMDRLVTVLGRLGQEVEFSFTVHPRAPRAAHRIRRISETGGIGESLPAVAGSGLRCAP
jgi:predicted XRE-type DNA-binding protein